MRYRIFIASLLIILNIQFLYLGFFSDKVKTVSASDNEEISFLEEERLKNIELQKKLSVALKVQEKIKARNKELQLKNSILEKELKEEKKVYPESLDITSRFKKQKLQEKSLSCEFAATADILSTLENRIIDEDELISMSPQEGFDKLPIKKDGKVYWGDPNKGFVGYIDKLPSGEIAKQGKETGYGVLEKPIANVYKKFGYKPKVITSEKYSSGYTKKEHLTELLKAINNGEYVQLWGDFCTTPSSEDTKHKNKCYKLNHDRSFTWYYMEDGKEVKHVGLKGEHAFNLLGYKGGIKNPTHIIVWDTKTGKHTYDIKEWYRKWNLMQNRSITVKKK